MKLLVCALTLIVFAGGVAFGEEASPLTLNPSDKAELQKHGMELRGSRTDAGPYQLTLVWTPAFLDKERCGGEIVKATLQWKKEDDSFSCVWVADKEHRLVANCTLSASILSTATLLLERADLSGWRRYQIDIRRLSPEKTSNQPTAGDGK